MASHEGARKRLKVSRTGETPTRTSMATVASSSKSARDMAAKNTASLPAPNHHEQTLNALNTDIDAMRQLVTCKICDRLLYEPYSLSCGHTYCYSCLSQWLVSNQKKTCPDCRAVTTQQPTPSYIIRELVLIFVSRSELLPDGETSEEHHKLAKEEAKIVANDKANTHPTTGGLFKGCFSRARQRLLPIHDPGDGVDRCPQCHWELEDGACPSCGFDLEDIEDQLGLNGYSDATDGDLSDDSSDAAFGGDGHDDFLGDDDFEGDNLTLAEGEEGLLHNLHQARNVEPIDLGSTSDEGSEDSELDPTMRDFIVADDEIGGASSDDGEDTDVPEVIHSRRVGPRRAHVVISDDEDDNAASTALDQSSTVADSDSDEDARPIVRPAPRRNERWRPRRELLTSDDEELQYSSGDGDDDDDEGDHESSVVRVGGFSPLDGSAGDSLSERSGYTSDRPSSIALWPMSDGADEEGSDGSDDEDGWGDTRARSETPRAQHQYQPTNTYRPEYYVPHSNRHVEPQHNYHGYFQGQPAVRSAARNQRGYEDYPHPRPIVYAPPPRHSHRPPVHPFQLGDTLAGINNYNQRNQQMRSNRNHRTVSAGSSRSRSSNGGGVGVQSSGTSGSSATIRPDSRRKRARALSISSDVSYE